jgi:hypothetical protein
MGVTPSLGLNAGDEVYKKYKNNTNEKWTRDPALRRLNMGIAFMFSSAAANGLVYFNFPDRSLVLIVKDSTGA